MKPKRHHTRRLLERLLRQARPYRFHLIGIFLLGLLATPLALLMPLPLMIAIDSGVDGAPLPGPLQGLPASLQTPTGVLIVVAAMQILVVLLFQLQSMAFTMLSTYTGERLTLGFRARLFRHLQRLSLAYHDTRGTADSIYRVQYDAPCIQEILVDGSIPIASAALTVVSMVVVTLRIDWVLAAVAIGVAPFLFLTARDYRKWTRRRYKDVKGLESGALGVVQEVFTSLRVVKAFGGEEGEQARFVGRAAEGARARIRLAFYEGLFSLAVNVITALGTALVLVLGIQHVRSGILSLGELAVVISYLGQLYAPLKMASKKVGDLQVSLAGAERAFEALDQRPEVRRRRDARPLQRAQGEIVFDDVTFERHGSSPVLYRVGFAVEAGTRLAVLGRTGEGKTTLVSLLARFVDPTGGRILLDGVDLRDYSLTDLRNQFAFVLQEPLLFSTSIAENIAYARPDATEREIVEAAQAAGVHDTIEGLRDGYDTLVGERGMRLSGGERQRIALARAFLKDAPILILDEPTSSVDPKTERAIMGAVTRLVRGRTTILISHRAGTARRYRARIELERGGIVSSAGVEVRSAGGLPPDDDREVDRPAGLLEGV